MIHLQRDNLEQAKVLAAEAELLLDPSGGLGNLNQQQAAYYANKVRLARTLIGNLEGDPQAIKEHGNLVSYGMSHNDSDTLVFYAAGEIERLGESGDIDGALKLLGQLPSYRVSAPGTYTTAAIAMTLAGKYEDAKLLFEQGLNDTLAQGLRPLHARGQLYYGLCQTLEGDPEGLDNLKRAAERLRRLGLNAVTRRDLQRVSVKLKPEQVSYVLDTVAVLQTRRLARKVLTIRLIGQGELLLDGVRVDLRGHTARAAVLLNQLHLQPEMNTAQIAKEVFDEHLAHMPTSEARKIKTQVSGLVLKIRKALGDALILRTGSQNDSMYQLNRALYQVVIDVDQLEDDLRAGSERLPHVVHALRPGILNSETLTWVIERREQVFGHCRDALLEAITRCESEVHLAELTSSVAVFGAVEGVLEEEVHPLLVALNQVRTKRPA
ncbi:hypothetical protein [Deinococcus multiflagellatus]|uniref:Tetratricopeptide repeat protein n=1 Tax=Deinococcus multiflagellatus TaxID=1656887 RepID=A0ABW1ZQ88_9DEIO